MATVTISPVTRIEGHLGVYAETEPVSETQPAAESQPAGPKSRFRVKSAKCEGEMFRGLETILQGRDPLDAQQITMRICGVCPVSHGLASIRAQEMAYGITPNHNGRLLQNLILAANYLQSHVLHFYHLAALDFVDVTAVLKYSGSDHTLRAVKSWVQESIARKDTFPAAPFLPRYDAKYVQDADRSVRLLSAPAVERRGQLVHPGGGALHRLHERALRPRAVIPILS
jgi:Ni,Fe-hydrogenase I large subunit